jgi:hypothetical protein
MYVALRGMAYMPTVGGSRPTFLVGTRLRLDRSTRECGALRILSTRQTCPSAREGVIGRRLHRREEGLYQPQPCAD